MKILPCIFFNPENYFCVQYLTKLLNLSSEISGPFSPVSVHKRTPEHTASAAPATSHLVPSLVAMPFDGGSF